MSHPDEEVLVDLALGDESDLTADQRAHVASCAACTDQVSQLARTRALVASSPPLARPSAGLWARIEQSLDDQEDEKDEKDEEDRAPTATDGAGMPPARRRARARWFSAAVAGAAAAGIVIGAVLGRSLWPETPPPAPTAVTLARAELDTLDTRQPLGRAQLEQTASRVTLSVSTQRLDPGAGYLEVWLLNQDGKRMVSLGVLRGEGTESFPVTQALIDAGYDIVDISREGFDDAPQHSGDSLARGRLAT